MQYEKLILADVIAVICSY